MKRILIVASVAVAAAVALAAPPRRVEHKRPDWPMKFPWATPELNEPVTLTKLEIACLKAGFDKQVGGIKFTAKETGEHIATVTAAEFAPGVRSLVAKIHVEPAEGKDLPSGFALSHIGDGVVDMRLYHAGVKREGPWGVSVSVRHKDKDVSGGPHKYGCNPRRDVSTAVPTAPSREPLLED